MLLRRLRTSLRHNYRQILLLLLFTSCLVYSSMETFRLMNNKTTLKTLGDRQLQENRHLVDRGVVKVTQAKVQPKVTAARLVISGQNITDKTVNKHGCDKWFKETFEGNLNVIANYPRGDADKYLNKLASNVTSSKHITTFPVIVTAANSGFYGVAQGLLKSIHEILLPKYKDIKIIFYDLGLTEKQYNMLKKYCKCEVRKFQFEIFPPHVRRLKAYAWKPLIVKTILQEYNWVWWMDSSVRFVTNDLDLALQYSVDNSILFFTYAVVLAVAQHTDVQTMEYLKEDRCKFRHFGEVEATFVLFHSDHVTDILVDQWAACALNEMCMAPKGTEKKLGCNPANKSDGRCHRFDQAVLSILLRRLYHDSNDYPLVDKKLHIHDIRRGDSVPYFPA